MNMNGSELNTSPEGHGDIKSKKAWVKPDIEIISKDIIHGGFIAFLPEGMTSSGFPGAS
ncbi:hypothetical protein [Pedobacter sp. L105]|uniref:hypothetical protein n=1 Tax=Pedobacter sp. L105 TaxID=1641871 RepID=UPI00131D0C0A|nr:hypothetical protein [Pedobacter sp. L105]